MAARQLPLFEDERPRGASSTFTGAPAASNVRWHSLGEAVAFVVMARCTSVTFKKVEGETVRQHVLQITDGQVVDSDWAMAKLLDLTAAEEAAQEEATRERNREAGLTVVEPEDEEGDG